MSVYLFEFEVKMNEIFIGTIDVVLLCTDNFIHLFAVFYGNEDEFVTGDKKIFLETCLPDLDGVVWKFEHHYIFCFYLKSSF